MIYISVWHNDARNNWFSPKDQGATNKDNWVLSTEFQYWKRIVAEINKLGMYKFVPYGLNLTQRIKWINDRCVDGDMCIELHMDSAPNAQWCSTWFMSDSKYAEDLAKVFQQEYTRITGIKGRWVHWDKTNRWGRLAFVRDTKCLAFLLEMGFITNSADRDKVWLKWAEGIDSWLALIEKKL
jgi:N-acetylmuramoyl-L-alanine amidase